MEDNMEDMEDNKTKKWKTTEKLHGCSEGEHAIPWIY